MLNRTLIAAGLIGLLTATAAQATPPSKPGLAPATDGYGTQVVTRAVGIEPLYLEPGTVLAADRLLPESRPGLGPTSATVVPRPASAGRAIVSDAAALQPEARPGLGPIYTGRSTGEAVAGRISGSTGDIN